MNQNKRRSLQVARKNRDEDLSKTYYDRGVELPMVPVTESANKEPDPSQGIVALPKSTEEPAFKGKYSYVPIPYPVIESEFEVQMFLVQHLRSFGMDVRGEVIAGPTMRMDIVVFDRHRMPIRIIEVKKLPTGKIKSTRRRGSSHIGRLSQISKYRQTGVPIDRVAGMQNAKKYLGVVRRNQGYTGCRGEFDFIEH